MDRQTPAERLAAEAGAERLAWLARKTQPELDRLAELIEGPEAGDALSPVPPCPGCGAPYWHGCAPSCPIDGEVEAR